MTDVLRTREGAEDADPRERGQSPAPESAPAASAAAIALVANAVTPVGVAEGALLPTGHWYTRPALHALAFDARAGAGHVVCSGSHPALAHSEFAPAGRGQRGSFGRNGPASPTA